MATSTTKRIPLAAQPTQAMNGEPLRCKVKITNPQGFHMRPQSVFAQRAGKYQSSVFLYVVEQQKFDGKSPFSLLGLLAEQGTEITVEVCGPDQDAALQDLAQLLANLHELDIESPDPPRQT
jgi:phosphocarrier protein HPr